jgi:RNA polymerase sigma factor (sigma-70 family)
MARPPAGARMRRVGEPEAGVELAGRLAASDNSVVRDLYQAYGRLVFTIALRIIGDRGRAEDAVQTTFVRLWQAANRIDPGRDVRPLLCTIARRVAIDVARAEGRRPWGNLEDADPSTEDNGVERAWTTWKVREALDALPTEEAEVMWLQHRDGMTHTQIAEKLGIAVGTVKSRSHRAHQRMAGLLSDLREGVTDEHVV